MPTNAQVAINVPAEVLDYVLKNLTFTIEEAGLPMLPVSFQDVVNTVKANMCAAGVSINQYTTPAVDLQATPASALDTGAGQGAEKMYPNGMLPSEEIDSIGESWNAKIHSANRTKTADGRWRKRRGVQEDTITITTNGQTNGQTAAIIDNGAPLYTGFASFGYPVEPAIPPVFTTMPTFTTPQSTETFHTLMPKITAAIANGKLTISTVTEVLKNNGLTDLKELIQRPELVSAVAVGLGV